MIKNKLKASWNAGKPTIGLWLSSADAVAAESLGRLEYDYTCLDLQHGLSDYNAVVPTLQALSSSATTPIARSPWNEPGIIGKILDAGMMGVIIPMVNSPQEAAAAVAACRYAPTGARSWGPTRANAALGGGYFDDANDQIACIPMIETAQAVEELEAILDVGGMDAIYVGPADLSISYGLRPATDHPDSPVFQEALAKIIEVCGQRGVVAGIHTVPELVQTRISQGFAMATATSNLLSQVDGARNALTVARGEGGFETGGMMYG